MILGSLQTLTTISVGSPENIDNSSLSNIDIVALLPDPDFDNAPTAVINGSSTEFTTSFTDVTGNVDSYIELRWDHTANTALDFVGPDPEGIYPDCNDFVYVYQEFDWPYEQIPDDAEVYFNYSTHRTGDFAEGVQELNNLMFRVYVWAIDSSGNWIEIYESREAVYYEEYRMIRANPNYLQMKDIFDGMVEQDGVQEDPEDTVKLAIGLAPTYRFENYLGSEPWTFYDGSVSIRLTFCDFYAYIETEDDPASIWQPEYNVTYGTTIGEEFPTNPNASMEVRNQCYGMVVGNDGSVYVTGNSGSPYDFYISDGLSFRNQFLLKYSPTLDLLWAVKNNNRTQVRSITFHEGFIYTTGYIDTDDNGKQLIVTKWSSSGAKVWESEWGSDHSQVGVGVAVHENGSVYVVVSDYEMMGFPIHMNASILKYDNNGLLLWDRQLEWMPLLYDVRGDLYIQGDYLYLMQSYGISIIDLEGEYIWGMGSNAAVPDGHNGFYTAVLDYINDVEGGTQIVLYHANATGYRSWNTTYVRQWPNGRYMNFRPVSMALTPEDKLLLLVFSFTLNYEFILLTYDLQCNLLENRTISTSSWPHYYGDAFFMDIGNAGLGYFAFNIYEDSIDINVQAFELYQAPGGFTLAITTFVIIASTVVIIGAVVAIFRGKRMK